MQRTGIILRMLIAVFLISTLSATAYAQPWTTTANTSGYTEKCTDFENLCKKMYENKPGLLTNISNYIKGIVDPATEKLFEAFTSSGAYQIAVNAAITLVIIFYAVAFTIGVTQASFGQILIRLVKIGFLYAIISPSGWQFFSDYVVKFFNEGTDELIRKVISIGTGAPMNKGDSPFLQLDGLAEFFISPDMIVAILGTTFASGPYGFAMGALIATAMLAVLQMLFEALKTYALSYVMRALLIGVAPLFLVFLLFDKTKNLFTGWLNSLINLSLQPILYFTFISFFLVMIMHSATDMLGYSSKNNNYCDPKKGINLCWVEFKNLEGSQNKVSFWRIKEPGDTAPATMPSDWRGTLSCRMNGGKTPDNKPCPEFPISIVDMLSFLILVYVARRFYTVIDRISTEISDASVNIDKVGRYEIGTLQKEKGDSNPSAGGVPKK